ncbi:MAG: hypothetical protein A2591_03330 [Candidatus Yonathbacteria bacterium RIFOXYD1_FULL_52_36]|uniref:Penicillin-binding protein 2 n=1 Tax=Candidatus Yonathbacteria bacterium RIFOXYD1_FULL_52_36 TaxID=1802730 RepID=A0A1G2SI59_9BACT|nr:MAG: hypothetical protein A2591_03330 [Candidatus Yonathbacteria bacterium RIFOXYD1_FULL_52_36]
MFFFRRRTRRSGGEIFPDEIFLDSRNLPNFNVHQMEGRIEQPISKWSIISLGIFFLAVVLIFSFRASVLQVVRGDAYREKAEDNRLERIPIFSERGVIVDRRGDELAWNTPLGNMAAATPPHTTALLSSIANAAPLVPASVATSTEVLSDPYVRSYTDAPGFAHMLGYVSYPLRDKKGVYYQPFFEGKAGIESLFNKELSGENGMRLIETNALGHVSSESSIEPPKDGDRIVLSIDAGVQQKLHESIRALAEDKGFTGGAGVILDVNTGEILALTSYPEYDPEVISLGDDSARIREYTQGSQKPLLNRALSGLYTPGSIVKPFVALGALEEGVISPDKQILSTGSITIPNPYNPDLPTVFRDWKAHGWVDMRRALAVSSDVYFYEIGGGYKNEQQGIGISNIEKYTRMFGIGELTGVPLLGEAKGVIPNPEWKAKNFDGEPWRLGNTYHTAIGQYGFQTTPLQMARAVAALANGGTLVTPQIMAGAQGERVTLPVHAPNIQIVKEGMRAAVAADYGTAKGLAFSQVAVAGKTGTAELGLTKEYVNSWTMGFFPYENPKYAFVVMMEKGHKSNLTGATFAMRQVIEWMINERPEYVGLPAKEGE